MDIQSLQEAIKLTELQLAHAKEHLRELELEYNPDHYSSTSVNSFPPRDNRNLWQRIRNKG
jgi:hypothetical protein